MPAGAALVQPLANKLKLRVLDEKSAEWREVAVPRSVRALVLLNIQVADFFAVWMPLSAFHALDVFSFLPYPTAMVQSYGGGRDIVGLDDTTLLQGQEFRQAPIFDDGLIEVLGLGCNLGGRVCVWVGGWVGE